MPKVAEQPARIAPSNAVGRRQFPEDILIGMHRDFVESYIITGKVYSFNISVGRETDFSTSSSELIKISRVPACWQNDVQRLMELSLDFYSRHNIGMGALVPVGHITIKISSEDIGEVARTTKYSPKVHFHSNFMFSEPYRDRAAPGLGYAAEGVALSSLKDQITHVSTTDSTSKRRVNQLKVVGLPFNRPVPIDEWLSGMLRGYRRSLRKASLAASVQTV